MELLKEIIREAMQHWEAWMLICLVVIAYRSSQIVGRLKEQNKRLALSAEKLNDVLATLEVLGTKGDDRQLNADDIARRQIHWRDVDERRAFLYRSEEERETFMKEGQVSDM